MWQHYNTERFQFRYCFFSIFRKIYMYLFPRIHLWEIYIYRKTSVHKTHYVWNWSKTKTGNMTYNVNFLCISCQISYHCFFLHHTIKSFQKLVAETVAFHKFFFIPFLFLSLLKISVYISLLWLNFILILITSLILFFKNIYECKLKQNIVFHVLI